MVFRTLAKISVLGSNFLDEVQQEIPLASLPISVGGLYDPDTTPPFPFDSSDDGLLTYAPPTVTLDVRSEQMIISLTKDVQFVEYKIPYFPEEYLSSVHAYNTVHFRHTVRSFNFPLGLDSKRKGALTVTLKQQLLSPVLPTSADGPNGMHPSKSNG